MKEIELFNDAKKLYDLLVAVSTGTNYSDPIIISDFDDARKKLIKQKKHK